jgi:uncharacterized membrane protein YgcG
MYARFAVARRISLCVFVLLLACLPAAARSWHVADMHDTISVGKDGSVLVQERITVVFVGSFQGIYRYIPTEYPGPKGTNYTLFLKVVSVADGDGTPLKYETHRNNGLLNLKIYVPGAVDTTSTVLISYTSPDALRYFDNYDEFYWNVTGNDWPVPIDHASAFVSFPTNAAGSLRAQAFTGVYGSHDQEATAQVEGSNVSFETTNPLPMRGGLTIDVYIPKGIINEPGTLTRIGWFLRSNLIIFLPVFAFAIMFPLWWYKGKDPNPGMSVAPMYEPPDQMSPAEVGALVDDSIDPRDITCTIVDLAVKGYLKIEQTDEKHLLFSSKDYIFHLVKPRSEWTNLASHERVIIGHMFADGADSVHMSSLKNHFYTAIPTIKQDILAELKTRGMYTVDPSAAGGYIVGGAILIAVPFILLQVTGAVDLFLSIPVAIVAIGLAVLIVLLFGRQMTAKSLKGVRTRVRILGFQEFMNRVDSDRLKRMPPDTFEKFLPYAMALGVEHRWAQAFQGLLTEPPSWFVGPGGFYGPGYGFNTIMFSNSMNSMATDMHSVMVSAPRASSTGSGWGGGGGFGGGGFSGGGFGGGGGGAF